MAGECCRCWLRTVGGAATAPAGATATEAGAANEAASCEAAAVAEGVSLWLPLVMPLVLPLFGRRPLRLVLPLWVPPTQAAAVAVALGMVVLLPLAPRMASCRP